MAVGALYLETILIYSMLIVDNNMNGTKNIVLFYKGRYIFAQIVY